MCEYALCRFCYQKPEWFHNKIVGTLILITTPTLIRFPHYPDPC